MELMEKIEKKFGENVKRLTVGPVPSHPKILEMLGKQFFSTRDALFVEVMPTLQKELQESVGTLKNVVILEHGSGSSGMSAIGNHLLCPGAKVIALNAGKFGERWIKVAKKRKCEIKEIEVGWGKPVNWAEVGKTLKELKPFALLIQHSETSTGSVYDLSEARKALDANSPDTLLIVDAISSWGSLPIDMDKNKIDAVVGCSQKGFMLPTGLHLLAFSEKALSQIKENNEKGLVTDLSHDPVKDAEEQLKGKPRFSMDSNSIMALYWFLKVLVPEMGGWPGLFSALHNRAEKIKAGIKKMGLELFSEVPGDVVIAVKTPSGMETKVVRKELYSLGFEVNGSQDAVKFDGIRIGNMGYVTDKDVDKLLLALGKVYKK